MTRITWDTVGERHFEAGVDRGVLYTEGNPGVPWSGLISVNESPEGGEVRSLYLDGLKYSQYNAPEEYRATLEAFDYPIEFAPCDGANHAYDGLIFTAQKREQFSFCYRTMIGNDVEATPSNYKLHLVYNALVAPSSRGYGTNTKLVNPAPYSWDITAMPPATTGFKPTAHVIVDTRYAADGMVEALENFLYGTTGDPPQLPSPDELLGLFLYGTIIIVEDHGDGTFSVTGPSDNVEMLDATTFQIDSPTAVYLDAETYTISST